MFCRQFSSRGRGRVTSQAVLQRLTAPARTNPQTGPKHTRNCTQSHTLTTLETRELQFCGIYTSHNTRELLNFSQVRPVEMCGRTACTLAPDEVSRASSYRNRGGQRRQPRWRDGDADKYRPSYNKSPQSMSPVLLSQRHFDKDAPVDECVLASMRWGLIPSWFKENDPSKMQYSTSNCRSENLLQKKSYKVHTEGEAPGEWTGWRLLTMAGLFDCWTPPDGGEPLYSYSVVTVNANSCYFFFFRMPAILDGEEEVRRWLDFGEVKSLDALKLLQSKNILTFHPVSSLVNNSRNNSPECLQPVDPNSKKEPKPTGSSKMMKSWLSSGVPSKRKESEMCQSQEEQDSETRPKSTGGLQRWLQGANKKPRTKPIR
uniref:Abasic site processing protein HMCES n=1 Tax=Amphiprion ocellaris TaxID=80972 RepID=A0AAQ5XU14_AMPOC